MAETQPLVQPNRGSMIARHLWRYAISLLLVNVAIGARLLFPGVFSETPYLAFYPAVVFAAALGGLGPGLLATGLCATTVGLIGGGVDQFGQSPIPWARQTVFIFASVAISTMAHMLRAALERQQRQALELRESEERYRAVAEHTHDWEFWLAPSGRFVYISPACLEVTGYAPEAFFDDPDLLNRIVHPEDQELYTAHHKDTEQAFAGEQLEFRIVRRDGTVRWISHRSVPVFDQGGAFIGVRGSNRDITSRKDAERRLRQSEQRYRTLFDSIDEGFCIVQVIFDQDGNAVDYQFLETNPSFAKQTGLVDAVGKTMRQLVPGLESHWYQAYGQVAQTGQPIRFENEARELGRWYDVYAFRFGLPENHQVAILFSDITHRRKMEEDLNAARLAAEQAKARAEDASRAKDHFLAVLSHELRTPLTPVVASLSVLETECTLDPEVREALEVVRRNVDLEARLIDDLLDVTSISRGKTELHRRPVQLCDVIRSAAEVMQPDIEARRLHFGIDFGQLPYVVHGDPTRLQQVFWNLLRNSIKFTPHGGCIGIRCRRDGEHVIVEVNDSGEGIAPDALERIFNAFEQAERSVTRQFGGLGLGLAITKALVEMHGGSVSAHSEGRGKGSTFRVRLPLVPEKPQVDVKPPPAPEVRPLRILLVEDHGDTARVMQMILQRANHNVQCAGDIATALELAQARPFDLLISDLGLPDGSGMDLLHKLRSRGHKFPAIALSGYGHEQDIQRSRQAGFALHLVKPITRDDLTRSIAATVS